ncbi:Decapping protein 1 [Carabus blaptoides fortunei]
MVQLNTVMAADLVELRMNVAALKRVDPYIKDILGTATQVALYTFSAVKNEWEKTDVEGALFVCSRNGEPYNSILIMNRLKPNNLVEPIVKDLDWQMQAPFLLYRNTRNCIYGIWFYNRDECVKITFLLENIMESLNSKQEKVKSKRPTVGADIFSMLSKAQEDFNKTPLKSDNHSQPQASTPRAPDVTSQSVMDFFAKASTTKTTHNTPARIPTGDSEPLQPLLHRLMSNPAHSVEHIEKQQRSVTPQEQPTTASLHVLSPAAVQEPSTSASAPALAHTMDRSSQSLLENGLNFMRIASPTTSSSPYFRQQPVTEDTEPRSVASPLATLLDTPQKPALMPPMMFTASGSTKEKSDMTPLQFVKSQDVLAPIQYAKPVDFSPVRPEPMTEKQIAQALQYLLKNDPEFLKKIHEAYVKSFTEIFS